MSSEKSKPEEPQFVKTNSDKSSDKSKEVREDDYGFYFFPDRVAPGEDPKEKTGFFNTKLYRDYLRHPATLRKAAVSVSVCRLNIEKCIQKDPLVRLLLGALKSQGCPVRRERHVTCEECLLHMSGGFDATINQIVLCENNTRSLTVACSVLGHELLHAFDACRAKFDYKNPDHVACTEVRAANLFHCSFTSAMSTKEASFTNIKRRHEQCVARKALISLLMNRNLSQEEAGESVQRVFERCYNDMEPMGRRHRKGYKMTHDARSYTDGILYGYVDPE